MWKVYSYSTQILLSVGLLFLAGCGSDRPIATALFSSPTVVSPMSGPYQYAGPWDADAFEGYITTGKEHAFDTSEYIHAGIVPHHLYAGYIPGAFFSSIKDQEVDHIVIIGPNHFGRGIGPIATTYRHWDTPFGQVRTNKAFVQTLLDLGIVHIEEEVIAEEHSIYSLIPFIAKLQPNATVTVLTLPVGADRGVLDTLIDALEGAGENTVFVGSVDFSHYQPSSVADFHDVLSTHVIETGSLEDVFSLEIDSPETVYTILSLMQRRGTARVAHVLSDNAAYITGDTEVAETTSYISPYFVSGEPDPATPIATVLHVGDIMLDRSVALRMQEHGGFDWLFEPLGGEERRFFSGVDRIVGNLEGPFADVRIDTTKEIAFRFDPMYADDLKEWGFDLVTLANNHSLDMGQLGFSDTKRHLSDHEIAFVGEQFAVTSSSLHIETVRGLRIAYVAINDTHLNIDSKDMIALVEQAEREADTTIVTIHWGTEYQLVSNSRQRELAHAFVDAGADAVIGHHPHVVQEVEVYQDRPIFYSLGNCIFDQYFSVPTQQGLAIGLVLSQNAVQSTYIFPIQSLRSQVEYMPYTTRQRFMQELVDRSRLGGYTIENYTLDLSYARPHAQ